MSSFFMQLQEERIFCPFSSVHDLQFLFMIKVTFILEELGTFGAALDAGVAFDAGSGNRGHIRRVDGSHRTYSGADAAVNTFGIS